MCVITEESSLLDWTNLNNLVNKKVKIVFFCPITLTIPRDGGKFMGYDMELPRDWVTKYGPALKIGFDILQIAFAAGRLAGLPIPSLSGIGK